MDSARLPRFDEPALASAVEKLSTEALDSLPFGAIRLDKQGVVQAYNATERRLSGSGSRPRVGLSFFVNVAPCMDNPAFRGRIDRAIAAGSLDMRFAWTGDFSDASRSFQVRAQSGAGGGFWIFIQRDLP